MKNIQNFIINGHIKANTFNIKGFEILAINVAKDEAIFLNDIEDIKELCDEDIYKKVKTELKGFASVSDCTTEDGSCDWVFILLV